MTTGMSAPVPPHHHRFQSLLDGIPDHTHRPMPPPTETAATSPSVTVLPDPGEEELASNRGRHVRSHGSAKSSCGRQHSNACSRVSCRQESGSGSQITSQQSPVDSILSRQVQWLAWHDTVQLAKSDGRSCVPKTAQGWSFSGMRARLQ